jgi:delta 1-pyrroline-5-carboxylate dehydrogenase
MARTFDTAAFMVELLQPVDLPADRDAMADHGLACEAEDIAEALEKVAAITAVRDAAPSGSRAKAVQQIMLNWWTKHLGELVGFHAEGC